MLIATPLIFSGNLMSGQVGRVHLASGTLLVQSGDVGSGSVHGFFGPTREIASGTVGVWDFGSGAVIAGTVGSGAVVSGNIASGQIWNNHFGSGAIVSVSREVALYASGAPHSLTVVGGLVASEVISGVRAVCTITSGNDLYYQVAMAGTSGRMPAVGLVFDNVNSGESIPIVYTNTVKLIASGLMDASGRQGEPLFVGRSGFLVAKSNLDLVSGDVLQQIGTVQHALPNNFYIAWFDLHAPYVSGGPPVVQSGGIGSGTVASGAVQGFFGSTRDIASGTVGVWDFGSGAVVAGTVGSGAIVSGNVASGQVGPFALASGILTSGFWLGSGIIGGQLGGTPFHISSGTIGSLNLGSGIVTNLYLGSGAVQSGAIASGQIGINHLASGALVSGWAFGSGSIWGRLGNQFLIASGTIGTFDIGSGQIVSGLVASGQVGHFHLAAKAAQSGQVGSGAIIGGWISGLSESIASGTIGPVDLASGTIFAGPGIGVTVSLSGIAITNTSGSASVSLTSGAVQSGHIASGAVQGYFGATRHIASGTVGFYDFGSGLAPQLLTVFQSGWQQTAMSEETISGVRAVNLSQSGYLRVAMASVSGRMPAIGVVVENALSGIQVNVCTDGVHQLSSGMADYSGQLGLQLVVGRSGHVVRVSGSWASGGFLSGDLIQRVGVARNSGAILVRIDPWTCRRSSG